MKKWLQKKKTGEEEEEIYLTEIHYNINLHMKEKRVVWKVIPICSCLPFQEREVHCLNLATSGSHLLPVHKFASHSD